MRVTLPSVEEARERMLARVEPLKSEVVAIDAADRRILRRAVRATRDQPPFNASAMDGWACLGSDLEGGPAELLIVGESAAGNGWTGSLSPGRAVRISTGAPLPTGADWVVVQEEAKSAGGKVVLSPSARSAPFVRARGGDFRAGDVLLTEGLRLDPSRVALAAAAGSAHLEVSTRPRVAIASTGNEIVTPGAAPGPWQIYDSAGAGLAAWFRGRGCDVQTIAPVRDDQEAVITALSEVECDLIVTVGGASVGDHDIIKPALLTLGIEMVVDGIAVRPGKPTWFGLLADGRRVLGLPGNPVSAMICAELFAYDVIAAMEKSLTGVRQLSSARLCRDLPANGPREHYMRATATLDRGGVLGVEVKDDQDSSLVSVLASATALVRRPPHASSARSGEIVDVMLLGWTSR